MREFLCMLKTPEMRRRKKESQAIPVSFSSWLSSPLIIVSSFEVTDQPAALMHHTQDFQLASDRLLIRTFLFQCGCPAFCQAIQDLKGAAAVIPAALKTSFFNFTVQLMDPFLLSF